MLFWKVRDKAKSSYRFYKVLDSYVEWYKIHNDAINTNQSNDFWAILDGQQRLTSLYIALCGTYAKHRYRARWDNSETNFPTLRLYLNISKKLVTEDDDKTYDFRFMDHNERLFVDRDNCKWFKVGEIYNVTTQDYDVDDFADEVNLKREEKKMVNMLKKVVFDSPVINYYEIEDSDPDVAVNIFTRINSGGTPLSFSNILMSMLIASWSNKDARTEIHNLIDSINNKGFRISQDYILKAIVYLYRNDVRFKIKTFSNSFIKQLEDKWDCIRKAIEELFELLKTFGFDGFNLTSNNATLPILYYIYHRDIYVGFSNLSQYKADREIIRKWLLKMLLLKVFGANSDNVLRESHSVFTPNMNDRLITDDVQQFPSDRMGYNEITNEQIDGLLNTHKDNNYAFAILSFLYPHLDYRYEFHKDHIHPFSKCREKDLDWEVYDTIVNLQMLDGIENMSKNAKDLSDWVDLETNADNRTQFLNSHLIPDVDLSIENCEEFWKVRRDMLAKRIRDLVAGN